MGEQINVLQRADVIVFSLFFKILKFLSSSYIPVAITGCRLDIREKKFIKRVVRH